MSEAWEQFCNAPEEEQVSRVLQAMADVVSETGWDHVYVDPLGERSYCAYVHEENDRLVPGCLIGAVLHRLGLPLENMWRQGNEGVGIWVAKNMAQPMPWAMSISDNAIAVLTIAQCAQDDGTTWGEALTRARNRARAL